MKYFLAVLLVISLGGCFDPLSGTCGNNIVEEVKSPNGQFKAVIFERNCGATTGFSTQVSILSAQTSLSNESGNVFVADDGDRKTVLAGRGNGPSVWAKWLGPNKLKIVYDRGARTFSMEKQYQGVSISYQPK